MGRKRRWQPPFPPARSANVTRADRTVEQLQRFAAKYRKCLVPGCGRPPADKLIESAVLLCGGHAHEVLSGFDAWLPLAAPPAAVEAEPEPAPEVGTVYYLSTGSGIKIGWTSNLGRRLKEYSPADRLLATEPGTRRLERARHHLFNEYLSYGREWFTDGPRLQQHIAQLIDLHGPPPELDVWRPVVKQDSMPGTLKTRRRSDRRHEHDGSAAVKRPAA